MSRRSGGCFTVSGIIAALLTLIVFGGVYAARGGEMFSPGALNATAAVQPIGGVLSHAETKGNCGACHVAPWDRRTMDERCLDCHVEIQDQISSPNTLHGILFESDGQTTCRECHTDHNGEEAGLTKAHITDFPHELVGFSLEGHARQSSGEEFTCANCHGDEIAHFELSKCSECHQTIDNGFMEAHQAAFGSECLACHDGVDRYGEAFDHSLTNYPLTGKHIQAGCAMCHEGARSVADLQATPQKCYDCHVDDDPHDGQMGIDCDTCHVTEGWEQVSFDHGQTGFVLIGKHIEVDCGECHLDLSFQNTPEDCFGCHANDDVHGGKFGTDCAACHTPEGWDDVTFDHSLTSFPLTGKHVGVECTECHVDGVFAGTAKECVGCHEEPQFHLGLFEATCEDCHTTDGWSPALFNGPHTFPITHGEGGASSCRTCHVDSLSTYTCYGCHEHTPENIAGKHLEEGIRDYNDCIACHPTGQEGEGGGEGGGGDDD